MKELSPKIAAELADGVYAVQDEFQLKFFLSKPIFSSSPQLKQSLKATVGTRLINTKDAFGVVARGGAAHANDLFLMFRGSTFSNYGADWFTNARCGANFSAGGLVHLGFYHTFSSMCTELGRFVSQQISSGAKPVDTIHCIGHSLGGAIATLSADWAKRTTKKHVVLYTFGAPKTGFEGFCFALTKMLGINNIHRMYHATDPVPMVPLYPFTHPPLPGYGHFKGSNEALLSVSAHFMGKYIESAEGATWDSMAGPPPQITFEQSVENFLMSHENVNPLSAASWVWINAAMEYVLKKIMGAAGVAVQFPFTNAVTLADKIALILLKGIELKIGADQWVLQLMRKMMQLLHMKVVETIRELTRALMRNILELIMARITAEAKKAIEQITKR